MMLYRSLVLGMLGAIALLIASPHPGAPAESAAAAVMVEPEGPPESAVVDVSRERAGNDVLPVLGLQPGERVLAVDGMPGDARLLIASWFDAEPGDFMDLAVRGPAGERRILVLVHP
jgi:hypothetical protein